MPPPNASPPQRLTGTEDEPMIIPELTEEGDSVIDKLGILGLPPLAVLGAIIGMLMCCIGIAAGCIMQQGRVDEAEKRRTAGCVSTRRRDLRRCAPSTRC